MTEDNRVVDVSSEIYERTVPAHVKLATLEAEKARVGREIRACEDEIERRERPSGIIPSAPRVTAAPLL